jgi:hypothetical protein
VTDTPLEEVKDERKRAVQAGDLEVRKAAKPELKAAGYALRNARCDGCNS